jgi:hypothetical protein
MVSFDLGKLGRCGWLANPGKPFGQVLGDLGMNRLPRYAFLG